MDSKKIKEISKATIICSIRDFSLKSLKKKPKFQILDLIIPKERKIRSIVGGLETSLGTTLWEPLAKALALENGFKVREADLEAPINMPSSLNNTLQTIIDDRKRGYGRHDAYSSHQEIKAICQSFIKRPIEGFEKAPRGKGVDIWLIKDEVNYFFDTKTVQPNIQTLGGCLEQILYWYAYFYSQNPLGQAQSRIVFPYNPSPETSFWSGVMNRGKPLEPGNEAWVEDEFWDFCSGYSGTYRIIEEAFKEIRESGELESTLSDLLNNHD